MFRWYITSMHPEHPMTRLCVKCLREHSKQKIEAILVPVRKTHNGRKSHANAIDIQILDDIPIKYVDTQQDRLFDETRAGTRKVRSLGISINEEHARLIGYGVNTFPCCVIDSDVIVYNNTIDTFINVHRTKLSRSICLFFETLDEIWSWHNRSKENTLPEMKPRVWRANKNVPFVHTGGVFFKMRSTTIIEHLNEIPDVSTEVTEIKKRIFTELIK
jgi:hypothetical protein